MCIRDSGKGNVEYWVAEIQPGKILYEIEGVSEDLARQAFALAAAKLPVKTTIVMRTVMTELRQKTVEELGTELDGLQLQQFGESHWPACQDASGRAGS